MDSEKIISSKLVNFYPYEHQQDYFRKLKIEWLNEGKNFNLSDYLRGLIDADIRSAEENTEEKIEELRQKIEKLKIDVIEHPSWKVSLAYYESELANLLGD